MHQQKLKNSSLPFGEILKICIDILTQNSQTLWLILIGIDLPLVILLQVAQVITEDRPILEDKPIFGIIFFIFSILFFTLGWLSIVVITENTILDEENNFKLAITRAILKLRKQIINLLVMWTIYFFSIGIGFLLFFIPGFYIATTYWFFPEAIALRNTTFLPHFNIAAI